MMQADKISLRRRIALEIERKFESDRVKEHPLLQLFWECTLRCNLACRHCGSDCRRASGVKDMPLADFLKVLDSVSAHCDPHKVFVVVTGGEPLMRSDLEQCGRAIYERGFPWGMVTNGLQMTPARFRALRRAGLHTATVSLDGLEQTHNRMRGHAKSFVSAIGAIKTMVAEKDFLFDVVTCVSSETFTQLNEIKQMLISLGVKRWRLFTIFPVGRAAGQDDLQLSPEQMRGLMDFIVATRKEGVIEVSYGCEGFLGNYEGSVRNHFYHCAAGVTVGSVLSDGSISACPSIRADYTQGNIYKDDFWEIWQSRFQKYRNREWARQGECEDCRFFRYCKGGGMHLHDGDGRLMFCHLHRLTAK